MGWWGGETGWDGILACDEEPIVSAFTGTLGTQVGSNRFLIGS